MNADLVGTNFFFQLGVLLLVQEVLGVLLDFPLAVFVHDAVIDKRLQLFSRLYQRHPKTVALNANLFEEHVQATGFLAWKLQAVSLLDLLGLFLQVLQASLFFLAVLSTGAFSILFRHAKADRD